MESKQITPETKLTDVQYYEILKIPGCPLRLPTAKSLMQAARDLDHLKPRLKEWHNEQTLSLTQLNKEL